MRIVLNKALHFYRTPFKFSPLAFKIFTIAQASGVCSFVRTFRDFITRNQRCIRFLGGQNRYQSDNLVVTPILFGKNQRYIIEPARIVNTTREKLTPVFRRYHWVTSWHRQRQERYIHLSKITKEVKSPARAKKRARRPRIANMLEL